MDPRAEPAPPPPAAAPPAADLSPDATAAVVAVEQYLRQGEPLLAYNAVQDGLRDSPDHLRLRQLQGLALARSGDLQRANALLQDLADQGRGDAETLGMLARTHKDLALEASAADSASHFAASFALYHDAYVAARRSGADAAAYYTGINAATVAALRGDLGTARRIAADVRALCEGLLQREGGTAAAGATGTDYWLVATLGEACLILGDPTAAATHYAAAARLAHGHFGNLGTTRRQARLLAAHLTGEAGWIDAGWIDKVLAIPPVVMFTGHMIDHPRRPQPRFPAALEQAVQSRLREQLRTLRAVAAYGSAACGSDLLFLEALRDAGVETHIVLPFPATEFRGVSVDFAGGAWGERFERALAAATSVTVTSDHRARGSDAPYDYANMVLSGMGRLRAQRLQTELRGLAIWDGRPSGLVGGAASLVQMWESQHVRIEHLHLPPAAAAPAGAARSGNVADAIAGTPGLPVTANSANSASTASTASTILTPATPDAEHLPAGFTHEIRALLFADAVGYSRLSEDQTPDFVTLFLGSVAALNRRSAHPPEHVETTGDGLYMVFPSARDAGRYALQLSELVGHTDWASHGLPPTMHVRIALHCGPVYCGTNPVTGARLYTGPHTSRTARIEPVTPPGQVYASSAFAAVVAAADVDDLDLQYVGRMPLAKGYGSLGLYHVRARALAAEPRAPKQG